MAVKDFVTRFVSDLARWRVADAASDLDQVADSAGRTDRALDDVDSAGTDAARGLDRAGAAARDAEDDLARMGAEAKDAGTDVERTGDDAEDAARRIADAFRRVGDSARDDVGEETRRASGQARESVAEIGEEAGGTAREMAASFSGSADDIADSIQEVAANALAVLGPAGLAVGVAAAVGLGAWRAQTEQQAEAVAELRTRLRELRDGTTDVDEATRDWLDGLEAKDLKALADDADDLGVSVGTLARAHAGDAEALALVLPAIAEYRDRSREAAEAVGEWVTPAAEMLGQTIGLQEKTADLSKTWGEAGEVAGLYAEALGQTTSEVEAATERQQSYGQALSDFVDPAALYQETLQANAQATADKTKDQADSWEDYAASTDVALGKVIEGLEKQVQAQESWAANMSRLAGRASQETLAYLADLGPEGAPLVAKLADASDTEMAKFEDLMRRRSASGVAAVAEEIDLGTSPAVMAARRQREAIAAVYAEKIQQLIEVKADPASISRVRQEAAQAANGAALSAARARS